jgi:hypothetical protein
VSLPYRRNGKGRNSLSGVWKSFSFTIIIKIAGVNKAVSLFFAWIINNFNIAGGYNILFLFNRSHMGTVEEIPRLALPSVQRAVLHLRQHTIGATSCQAQWSTGRNFGDITQRSLKSNFLLFLGNIFRS